MLTRILLFIQSVSWYSLATLALIVSAISLQSTPLAISAVATAVLASKK